MDSQTTIRLAQSIGVVGCAYNAGATIMISALAIPALLQSPAPLMARQWQAIYDRGKKMGPSVALPTSVAFAWLAYTVPGMRFAYGAAAALPFAIMPYTVLLMAPTNSALIQRAEAAKAGKGAVPAAGQDSTAELVARWSALNYVRGAISLAGAAYGVWTVLA